MAFGPKGTQILSGSTGGQVRMHSAVSGEVLYVVGEHADVVHAVAWSASAGLLASASDDGEYRLWKPDARRPLRTWTVPAKTTAARKVWSLVFSPDGKTLVSASGDGGIRLFDVATGAVRLRLAGHEGRVLCLALSADGKRLASGGEDKTVRIWDLATGKALARLGGHAKHVYAVAWHPNGRWLASGSYDGSVRLWDVAGGLVRQRIDAHKDGVYGVAFAPDGARLAIACEGGVALLYGLP